MTDLTVSPGDLIRAEDWNALVGRVPPGTILEWPTSTAPAGWMLCDGGPVPADAHALRSALGGASTVPDRRAPVATLLARHAAYHGNQRLDATFQNIGSAASFTKGATASDVLIEWSTSAWVSAAGSGGGRALGRIHLSGPNGSLDDGMYPYYFNAVNDHRYFGSAQRVNGMVAGAWTGQIQLALSPPAGGSTLTLDNNDAFTIVVWEIQTRHHIVKL